jgi:hypothetical protein
MDSTFYITGQAVITAICWLIVAGAAVIAVCAKSINDTVLERIGLCAVAYVALGAAWRIGAAGWVSNGGTSLAVSLAFYVIVVIIKHVRRYQP